MKIRSKITLWVAGAGLLTSLVFSLVVFFEMREQPYQVLDADLDVAARAVAGRLALEKREETPLEVKILSIPGSLYWIKVYDKNMSLVYRSGFTDIADIPLYKNTKGGYTVTTSIPEARVSSGRDKEGELTFRAKVVLARFGGASYLIQIARPIENLEDEFSDLIIALAAGLVASTLLLALLSYIVAGRIIRPIGIISGLSKEISHKTLGKRIPLGKSRDELYELSDALNQMFDRLQYSFAKQKEFLANASHELKTPTAMLRLFFEESAHREDLPDDLHRQLINQGNIVLRMERLVKRLMDLSVLELKDSIEMKEFSLTGLMRSLLEDFSSIFATGDINVEAHLPTQVSMRGDEEQIRRMLINIFENAFKYNDREGRIKLELSQDKDSVRLSLFNTGAGIPKGELEKVFEQFYRVEKSRSLQHGGAGLGLAIVREIVRLHDGTVTMESEPGAWARIRITLPKRHV